MPRGQPPRRRRRGRAARRRAHLAARAAAGLPQRRPAGDLQVAAGVDGAPVGALRLRHRRHAGRRQRAAAHPRLPRPDHQRRGRHRRPRARSCGGASPRSCCARACAPTATPAASCSPPCARCRATSCSRRPTTDLLRLAQLVVDRAEHRSVGVFARIHLNRDFVSVLVYFPADRFGPETRRRVTDVINQLLARRDHRPRRPHRRARPGPHAVADRGAPGRAAAVARPRRGRGRGRQGDPPLERRLRRPADHRRRRGRGRAAAAPSTPARCPRPTRRTSAPRSPSATSPGSRRCRADDGLAFDLYTPDHGRRGRPAAEGLPHRAGGVARAGPADLHPDGHRGARRAALRDRAAPTATTVWIYDFGLRLPAGIELRRRPRART